MKKAKIKFKFDIKKRILPVAVLAVCTPLILFVAIPFEVFANNLDEFLFSLSSFLPLCVLFGFLLAAVIAIGIIFLPEKIYRVAYAIILALSFLFFLQGTFLNFGMTSLIGDKLGSNEVNIGLKILDLIIWIAVFGVAIALSLIKDKKGIFAIIAVILAIVVATTQIMVPVSSTIKHPDVFLSKEARLSKGDKNFQNKIVTDENLTSVATKRNVFYFCIDRFDEYFAETAAEVNPEIYDGLDGFVWFKDNLSLFNSTFPAVAHMLTETPFNLKYNRKDFLDTVYSDNNTLSVLDKNGYSVNIFTQPYYAYNTANNLPDYIDNISVAKKYKTEHPARLAKHFVATAAYRCIPIFLKDLIFGVKSGKFNECITSVGENGYSDYDTTKRAYRQAAETTFENLGEKNFSFIHVDGCHDVTLDYISKSVSEKQKKRITKSVEKNIRFVNSYIKVLKEKNLYKDATIIITGDHPDPIDENAFPEGAKLTALFFKRSGEENTPLKTSFAPVAHENIWASIMQSENLTRENNGTGLFDIAENDTEHERKYIWHTHIRYVCDEIIYSIKGSARDFDNWKVAERNHYDKFIME